MKRLFRGPDGQRLAALAVALTFSFSLSDCAIFRGRGGHAHGSVAIQVRNDNWLDVDVFLMRNGQPERLGMVNSLSEESFAVDADRFHVNDIRVLVDPIGSNATWTSPAIVLGSGQGIRVDIKNALSLSTVSVY